MQACSDSAQGKASFPHQESDELEYYAPTSVSKSVQTGGVSTEDRFNDAKTSEILHVVDNQSRARRPEMAIRHNPLLQIKSRPSDHGDLQPSESAGKDGGYDFRPSSFPTAMKVTGDSESRLKRRPDSSSIESRPGKNGKRTLSPEEMGVLDSRINYHMLKAGLRRRAPSIRNALRVKKKTFGSRSPRKDGGKRLRTRTMLDLNLKAYSAKVVPHEEKFGPPCQEGVDVQWQSEVADCEAEYETFVENTDVHGCEEDTSNASREVPTSEKEESQKRITSPSRISNPEVKAKLSEAPVLSLMKTPQAPKKTFIRCIDLVVASKKKNQLSKVNGRKICGVRYSFRRVDCSKSLLTDDCGLDRDCQFDPQVNQGTLVTSKVNGYF